jgi:hypothetical protein
VEEEGDTAWRDSHQLRGGHHCWILVVWEDHQLQFFTSLWTSSSPHLSLLELASEGGRAALEGKRGLMSPHRIWADPLPPCSGLAVDVEAWALGVEDEHDTAIAALEVARLVLRSEVEEGEHKRERRGHEGIPVDERCCCW